MAAEGAPDPAERLEAALERIVRAAHAREIQATPVHPALPQAPTRVTTPEEMGQGVDILSRLDALIAELRSVLGTQA
jgi:hypothetical protein